ncbi:hypothetical protein JXL21_03125 [Candidatus Bathyarchaeota archaeon]|nr:hypothetical protein [Candidatus Bathyarchaeota archaeon]
MDKLPRNNVIRQYYSRSILVLMLSGILILASLYQLEIILIWVSHGRTIFEFPFFLWTMNVWMARDVWYGALFVGWLLGAYSAFKLGEVSLIEAIQRDPKDAAILREIIQQHKDNVQQADYDEG